MSSPYQSNILRFLIGRYRLGLDRHRRAVMNTRSTMALGAEVGAVLMMTPVYAAARLSQSVRQWLRRAVVQRRLPAAFSKAVSRLVSAGSRGSSGNGGLTLWPRSSVSTDEGGEHKETVSLTEQVRPGSVGKAVSRFVAKTMSVVRAAIGRVVPVDSEEELHQENDEAAIAPSPQSSDFIANKGSAYQAKDSLVRSTRSFWVALLEAVTNLRTQWNARKLKGAFTTLPETASSELPGSRQLRQLSLDFVNAVSLPRGKTGGDLRTTPGSEVDPHADTNRCLDTKVAAFEYIEHPLETALKWIDRILTWIESRWGILSKAWHRWLSGT